MLRRKFRNLDQVIALSAEEAGHAREIIRESGSLLDEIERQLRAIGTDPNPARAIDGGPLPAPSWLHSSRI